MATVWYDFWPVADRETGLPLVGVRGLSGRIVARGTTTDLTLVDANGLPVPQPVTVTNDGFLPGFGVVEGAVEADWVSGSIRIPIWSPKGLRDDAAASAASAAVAAAAAESAADLAADAAEGVLPPGGATGQVLAKASGADRDTQWVTPASGGEGGGTNDHGALAGLADDDHMQYHNDARGDARYYRKAEVDTIATAAATASSAADRSRANHTGVQGISSVDGLEGRLAALEAGGGGGGGPITTDSITDMTATGKTLAKATSAAAARAALGAGTSNLQIGTAAGTAADAAAVTTALGGKAGTAHTHTTSQITDLSTALPAIVEPLVEPIVAGMASELGDQAVARTVYGSQAGQILPPWNTNKPFGPNRWTTAMFHGSGQTSTVAPSVTANGSPQSLITYVKMNELNNGGLDPYRLEFDFVAPASGTANVRVSMVVAAQTLLPGTAEQYVVTHETPARSGHVVLDLQAPDFNGNFTYLKVELKVENNVTVGQKLELTNVELRRIPRLSPPMLVAYGFAPGAPTVWIRHTNARGVRKTTKTLLNGDGIASTLEFDGWTPWRWSYPDPEFKEATAVWDGKIGSDETKVGIVSGDLNVGNNDQILSVKLDGGSFELRGNVHGGEEPTNTAYKIDEGKGAGLVAWVPGSSLSALKSCRRYQVRWDTKLVRSSDASSSPFANVEHLTTVFDDGMMRTDRSTTFPKAAVIGDNFEWMSSHGLSPLWLGRIGKGQTVIADVDTRGLMAPLTTAPTSSTATTGGTLPAATYRYSITLLTDYGETTVGPERTQTTTGSTSTVTVTYGAGFAGLTGVRAWRLYRTNVAGGTPLLVATVPATSTGYTDTGAVTPSTPAPRVNTARTSTPTRREVAATDATWSVWYDPTFDLCYANIFDRDALLARSGVDAATTRLQMIPGSITKEYINAVWNTADGTVAVGPSTPAWAVTHWSYIYSPNDPVNFHREVADKAANLGALKAMYPAT